MRVEESFTETITKHKIIGRRCDFCHKEINPYNYFLVSVCHNDWGNDSVDSYEEMDACSPECVMIFTKEYVNDSYENPHNTKRIEIKHARALCEGT